jgi:hypothetical protein
LEKAKAVAFLISRGFHAFERKWAMGETIGVAAHPMDSGLGSPAWRRMVYIARRSAGWIVVDLDRPAPVDSEATGLTGAVAGAESILSSPLPNKPLRPT